MNQRKLPAGAKPLPGGPGALEENLEILPVILFTAVSALFVRLVIFFRDMSPFYWRADETRAFPYSHDYNQDFLLLGKTRCIEAAAALALLFLALRLIRRRPIVKSAVYIPMAIYALFVIVSYAFSDYKIFAFEGWNELFEGTIVIISYLIMLFYIINVMNSEKRLSALILAMSIAVFVMSITGVFQLADKDPFRFQFVEKLITPRRVNAGQGEADVWGAIDRYHKEGGALIEKRFDGKMIYSTLSNPNYVAQVFTLFIPFFAMLFLWADWKTRRRRKCLWGLLLGLSVFTELGSGSSGGLPGCFVSLLAAALLLNRRLIAWGKNTIAVVLIIASGFAGEHFFAGYTGGRSWVDEVIETFSNIRTLPPPPPINLIISSRRRTG